MSKERLATPVNGWLMLPITIALYIAAVALFVLAFVNGESRPGEEVQPVAGLCIIGALVALAASCSPGFFTLQPNETRVLVLFGNYKGTVRQGASTGPTPSTPTGPADPERHRPGSGRGGKKDGRRPAAGAPASATRSRCGPAPSTARGSR